MAPQVPRVRWARKALLVKQVLKVLLDYPVPQVLKVLQAPVVKQVLPVHKAHRALKAK